MDCANNDFGFECRHLNSVGRDLIMGYTAAYQNRSLSFCNTADHSTVCYALKRIDALRKAEPEVDALLTSLAHEILSAPVRQPNIHRNRQPVVSVVQLVKRSETGFLDTLAERIAERLQRRECQCRFCARCGEATGAPAAGK